MRVPTITLASGISIPPVFPPPPVLGNAPGDRAMRAAAPPAAGRGAGRHQAAHSLRGHRVANKVDAGDAGSHAVHRFSGFPLGP